MTSYTEYPTYDSFELNPCIRKGKYKSTYKKHNKYEAKIQRVNLIRSKRDKLLINNWHTNINNNKLFIISNDTNIKEMIKILRENDIYKWDNEYEMIYKKYVNNMDNKYFNEDLIMDYMNLKMRLEDNHINYGWTCNVSTTYGVTYPFDITDEYHEHSKYDKYIGY